MLLWFKDLLNVTTIIRGDQIAATRSFLYAHLLAALFSDKVTPNIDTSVEKREAN